MTPHIQKLPLSEQSSFLADTFITPNFETPWHYHPEYELVLIIKSTGRRMVGDHIGYFDEGDLVFMGPELPHVWVNDTKYTTGQADSPASAIVIQFIEQFHTPAFGRARHRASGEAGADAVAEQPAGTVRPVAPGGHRFGPTR